MSALISDALLGSLGDFFFRTVTVQSYTVAENAIGEQVRTWSDMSGHTDIPCSISPTGGHEITREDGTSLRTTHRIMLKGRYPSITAGHRLVDDEGRVYDVEVPGEDSQKILTRLDVQHVP